MMTTMAAMMGTLPIALGFGAGAEARRSLGLSVVGGLMFSQVVTLFLTPVVYIYMEQAKGWSTRTFGKRRRVAPEVVPTAGPVGGGTIGAPMARIAEPQGDSPSATLLACQFSQQGSEKSSAPNTNQKQRAKQNHGINTGAAFTRPIDVLD